MLHTEDTTHCIEDGKSDVHNTLKRLETLYCYPEVALKQLKQTSGKVHFRVLSTLMAYYRDSNAALTAHTQPLATSRHVA